MKLNRHVVAHAVLDFSRALLRRLKRRQQCTLYKLLLLFRRMCLQPRVSRLTLLL